MPTPTTLPPNPATIPIFGLMLTRVRVQDFRALTDIVLEIDPDITVLIGENNTGKTSFLEALAVALGDRRAHLEDLHRSPSGIAKEFQIDIRIEPTDDDEFPDQAHDAFGDAIQYDATKAYLVLRCHGRPSPDGLDIAIEREYVKGWADDRAKAAALVVTKRSVSRAALALLRFDMLDARRDIVEQLRNRRTHWGRTASAIDVTEGLKTSIENALKALGDQIVTESAVLADVQTSLADLGAAMSRDAMAIDIEVLPRKLDDVVRAMEIVITADGSAPFAAGAQGMGTRSLAAMMVFRAYINVVRARSAANCMLSLAAFEELEAHLHPQSQRAVFDVLSGIAGQKVISTHSAHVAAIASVQSYRVFRRNGSKTDVFSLGNQNLSDPVKTARFTQARNSEMFFARAVAVYEGQSEAAAMPIFASAFWRRGADGVGVSLVYTEGAGNSQHLVPLLEVLGIPWVLFCDGDPAGDDGLAALSKVIGRTLTRASPEIVQLPDKMALEEYLVDAGYGAPARSAADRHPNGPLERYRKQRNGSRYPEKSKFGATRDYDSSGWEDRLIRDFLIAQKGTIFSLVAEEICNLDESLGQAKIPPLIAEFLRRIDSKLRGRA